MRKLILKLTLGFATAIFSINAYAQCPTISCPTNITVNNDSANCDAVVAYTVPTGGDPCNTAPVSQIFNYTGAQQMFIVPTGVTVITVDAYGAQGGANWVSNVNYGGYVQADIPVVPGDTIFIYVGEQPTGLTGGWNGGGNGETGGIGGGGASDIRIGGTTYNDRVIVAGGAGGAGYWSSTHVYGGLGGGLVGGPGYRGTTANPGGDPGTQTTSGNGTCISTNNPICTGGFGYGGAPSSCGCEGYGGGAGWYGGAGSGNCRGGGGGSSYTIPTATNVTHLQGVRVGHGEITISYDSLGPVTIAQTGGLASGAIFPLGTTTNTYTATDAFNNVVSCSFTVTVVDAEAPTITCPANVASCDSLVNGLAPTTADNCTGETVTYNLSGATTGIGVADASGTLFNLGTTTIWYYVTDVAGNKDSCSFDVTINPLPSVAIATFNPDTICVNDPVVTLPVGTPTAGSYSGTGVSGTTFDPSVAGVGAHYVVYSYTDANSCTNSDSTMIVVESCVGINENTSLSRISIYPNPTNGMININFGNHNGPINYTLTTVEGKIVVKQNNINGNKVTINLSNESKGIYFLKIEDVTSAKVYKIIKE
jgi:hypothetical protein